MRPPELYEKNVVVVLDTLPECKVVLDGIEDLSVPRQSYDMSSDEDRRAWGDSIGVRFRQQAREHEYYDIAEQPYFTTSESWREHPEFRVRTDDVEFIKDSAKRILAERNISERIFNRITHRTKAAKSILSQLSD